ncbi:MAG: PilZ domain-containing protein [Magnetococcales bacterium]|nr:PilZ domain-containing protein [Magnetococcales bacterium]
MASPAPKAPPRQKILLWWRKVTPRMLKSACQQMSRTGQMPGVNAIPLDEPTRALFEQSNTTPPASSAGGHTALARRDVFDLLDIKFARLLRQALPGTLLGDTTVTPMPMVAILSPLGLAFWDRDAGLKPGHVLEVQYWPFPDNPMKIRAFARVIRVHPPNEADRVRVDCRFEKLEQTIQKHEKPVRRSAPPPPEPIKPAPPEPEIIDLDAPGIPPPPPPPEPMVKAAFQPKPEPEPEPEPEAKKGDGKNKRQSFRLNDDIPFTWKLISEHDYELALNHLFHENELPPRAMEAKFNAALQRLDRDIVFLRKMRSKAANSANWLKEQLQKQFLGAGMPAEEEIYFFLLVRVANVVEELVELRPIPPKAVQLMDHMKSKFQYIRQRDESELANDGQRLQKSLEALSNLERQITKKGLDLEDRAPEAGKRLRQLSDKLSILEFKSIDPPSKPVKGPEGLPIYTINISATGLAFRTFKQGLQNGDILSIRMGLGLSDDVQIEECFGKVVMTKGPEEDGSFRIACQVIDQSDELRDRIHYHITQRQREILSEQWRKNNME